jgi:hypothetical protein
MRPNRKPCVQCGHVPSSTATNTETGEVLCLDRVACRERQKQAEDRGAADSFAEARQKITGESWLDDLSRASLSAAKEKFD